MKGPSTRQLVSQSIIVLAACAGVSLGLLQPLKGRLIAERSQLATGQSLVAQYQSMRVVDEDPALRNRHAALRAALQERAAPAESAASLHNTLMTLAHETGVTIEGVEPKLIDLPAQAATAAVVAGAASAPTSPIPPSIVFSASITGHGSYEAIAAFLARLEGAGLARLVSGQVTPQHDPAGEPSVRFAVTSVHFGFKVPSAPAQAMATGGGS